MAYAPISELQRVLNLPAPTTAQTTAMQRALDAAAEEIDWELDYDPVVHPAPVPPPPLVVQVNLDRATELWKSSFSPYGIVPTGPDIVPVFAARDSWYRHHLTLLPLKTSFGVG
jgi:hypothetical protein